jgi:chaperonin GroES
MLLPSPIKILFSNQNQLITMSKVSLKPLADRVLVKPADAEEKTKGGIIIPDTAKEKPMKGKVIAVGNGKKDEPMTVKAGDTVLYGKYAGTEITIDSDEYLIMRESDIFAIV